MAPIDINPELRKVKEKYFGMDWGQIATVTVCIIISVTVYFLLPAALSILREFLAVLLMSPVVISLKEFYGLRGFKLLSAIRFSVINSKPLVYQSEAWKKVKNYEGS